MKATKPIIEETKVDENLRIYSGGGCNSAVLTSRDGTKALIVDTKYFTGAWALRNTIRATDIVIINTHFHMDHAMGNRLYPKAYVVSGQVGWQWHVDTGFSKRPDRAMMPGEETVLSFDGETIRVSCVGKAHSLSDSIVFFEERKLLMAGDLVWENMHPVLIGSDVTSWRRVLNTLEKGCLAEVIVPGHGNITDMKAITKMAGYFDSIAAAVGDPDRMVGLKRQYNSYYQFPLFSGVGAVARLIKRETARSHRNSNSRLGLSK